MWFIKFIERVNQKNTKIYFANQAVCMCINVLFIVSMYTLVSV